METAMPIVRKWIKGPMWLHFLVGVSYQQRCRIPFLCSLLFVFRACYIHKQSAKKPVNCLVKFYYWCFFISVSMQAPPVIILSSACAGLAGLRSSSPPLIHYFWSISITGRMKQVFAYDVILVFVNNLNAVSFFGGMFAGGTVPALAQLASSSYRAAVHSSQPPQAQKNNKIQKSTTSPL